MKDTDDNGEESTYDLTTSNKPENDKISGVVLEDTSDQKTFMKSFIKDVYGSENDVQLAEHETECTIDEESDIEMNEDESAPWYYNPNVFLPGRLTAYTIFGMFPFLAIGRFIPIIDFISDIASAGTSCE